MKAQLLQDLARGKMNFGLGFGVWGLGFRGFWSAVDALTALTAELSWLSNILLGGSLQQSSGRQAGGS